VVRAGNLLSIGSGYIKTLGKLTEG